MEKLHLYTIMPLDVDHIDEICEDIRLQYESGVATCALFSMTLVPEGNPPAPKAEILCEKYKLFKKRLDDMGIPSGILVQATLGHRREGHDSPFQKYVSLISGTEEGYHCPMDPAFLEHMKGQMKRI